VIQDDLPILFEHQLDPDAVKMKASHHFDDYIAQVAAETLKRGGTASKPATGQFLPPSDVWSFPKYPSRTVILPPNVNHENALREFILRNEVYLNEEDCWLGTWIHPRTGEYYLDIAMGIADVNEARKTAMQVSADDGRRIVAMFNSLRGETVFLFGEFG
jgi:hypothetical protein